MAENYPFLFSATHAPPPDLQLASDGDYHCVQNQGKSCSFAANPGEAGMSLAHPSNMVRSQDKRERTSTFAPLPPPKKHCTNVTQGSTKGVTHIDTCSVLGSLDEKDGQLSLPSSAVELPLSYPPASTASSPSPILNETGFGFSLEDVVPTPDATVGNESVQVIPSSPCVTQSNSATQQPRRLRPILPRPPTSKVQYLAEDLTSQSRTRPVPPRGDESNLSVYVCRKQEKGKLIGAVLTACGRGFRIKTCGNEEVGPLLFIIEGIPQCIDYYSIHVDSSSFAVRRQPREKPLKFDELHTIPSNGQLYLRLCLQDKERTPTTFSINFYKTKDKSSLREDLALNFPSLKPCPSHSPRNRIEPKCECNVPTTEFLSFSKGWKIQNTCNCTKASGDNTPPATTAHP